MNVCNWTKYPQGIIDHLAHAFDEKNGSRKSCASVPLKVNSLDFRYQKIRWSSYILSKNLHSATQFE